jgi:LacI family transcriptional regulator
MQTEIQPSVLPSAVPGLATPGTVVSAIQSGTVPATPSSIRDVARRAGVSIATVSRVINGRGKFSPTTFERVQQAIEALEYTPNAAARSLVSGRTRVISCLFGSCNLGGDFGGELLNSIIEAVRVQGYDLLLFTANQGSAGKIGPHNSDGLLVFADRSRAQDLREMERSDFPTVLLYRSPSPGSSLLGITVDNAVGARRAVMHLIRVHHRRRIAFLAGPMGNEDAQGREAGYLAALAEEGLTPDPALIGRADFEVTLAETAVRSWLAEGVQFDAIFAADDESASGALRALKAGGVRVPEDVSLIGFNDVRLSAHLDPALTTVYAPTRQVGRQAVAQLIARIEGKDLPPNLNLPTKLVIRRSCGCHPDGL